jgi:hypothetical protein
VRIGALVGKVTSLPTSIELPFTLQWVLSSLSPLNILIPSSRGLEIVRVLNHLMMRGGISLSRYSWLRLKQRLSRMEHRSS